MKISSILPNYCVKDAKKAFVYQTFGSKKSVNKDDIFAKQDRPKKDRKLKESEQKLLAFSLALLTSLCAYMTNEVYRDVKEFQTSENKTHNDELYEITQNIETSNAIDEISEDEGSFESSIPQKVTLIKDMEDKYLALIYGENSNLSEEEKEKYLDIFHQIELRGIYQSEVGEVYYDKRDDSAYIYLKVQISKDYIEQVFGIDEGVLEKHNEIKTAFVKNPFYGVLEKQQEYEEVVVNRVLKIPMENLDLLKGIEID